MTDPDRRPFWKRHPALLAGIVVLVPLCIAAPIMVVRYVMMSWGFNTKKFPVQINTWSALTFIFPVCFIVLLTLAWRRRLGPPPDYLCRRCGYDRRGVPDLSPCPECGAPTTGE